MTCFFCEELRMKFDVTVLTSELTAARRSHCEGLAVELRKHAEVQSFRFLVGNEASTITRDFVKDHVRLETLADPRLEKFNKYAKTLHLRNLSNALNHLAALKYVAERPDDDDVAYLVLEDDVLATVDWITNLKESAAALPPGTGFLSLGVPSKGGARFQQLGSEFEVLPCCDSYLVRPSTAKVLAAAFLPVRFTTNVHLTYLLKSLQLGASVCHPHVFLDGTKYGAFISVVSAGNQLILNSTYMGARRQLVDEKAGDAEKLRDILDSLAASPFGGHPDFVHMKALATWRLSGPAAAAEVFKAAQGIYDANNALLNSESQFLRDYIALHRELQS